MVRKLVTLLALGVVVGAPATSRADTIDPTSYAATLNVGDSVTIRKTVVIEAGDPTGALLDVVFLIDTSGSMGGVIAAAKTAALDILAGLDAFGDLSAGSGYYSDPGFDGLFRPISTDAGDQADAINDIVLLLGGGGGDFPELGFDAAKEAAEGTAWRPGSNRFIIALGDATFHTSATSGTSSTTEAATIAALDAVNATFIGIDFGAMDPGVGSPAGLAAATGGSVVNSAVGPDAIVDAIIASVSAAFADYDDVTVSDLGAGLPGVATSVVCVSADIGVCAGDTASGMYDRSVDRTFEYDVTFTALADGVWTFPTRAIVDGGIVATETDEITVGAVPEPASLMLLGLGLLGVGAARRRRAA
jgi:Mg-chelatase subunit ChlD